MGTCTRWRENDFDLSRTAARVLTVGSAPESFEYERGSTASAFSVLKAANRIVKIEIEYRAIRATITQVIRKRTFFNLLEPHHRTAAVLVPFGPAFWSAWGSLQVEQLRRLSVSIATLLCSSARCAW